jgi:hypothetical protein
MACRYREQQRRTHTGSLDCPPRETGAKRFHIAFPIQNDVLVRVPPRRIEDLVSPQSVRFK